MHTHICTAFAMLDRFAIKVTDKHQQNIAIANLELLPD